ncbi:MAG: cyclophilin-like fold protein [bacterium]
MHFGDTVIPGVLNDSETAQALIAKLPYTQHMSRYSHDFCGVTEDLPYNEDEEHYGWLNGDIDYATDAPYFTILFEDQDVSEVYGNQVNIGVITCPLQDIAALEGSYDVVIELDNDERIKLEAINMMKSEELTLTQEWDKVFPKSDKVDHCKVTFPNHFGITLAADMYVPKGSTGRLPAIAVCGPFGACKEQSSGLYAQEMAERGFLAIAFDPSFTGESGGMPRAMHSPDIDIEDFQAAVDFLSCCDRVDTDRIGIIGICGWGGMALQTACLDTRVKATVTSTMYDMSRIAGNGYFDADDSKEARKAARQAINAQRTEDFRSGAYALAGGVVDPLPEDAPFFVKDYYDYYKTERGYHPRSLNSNGGWAVTAGTSLMNTRLFTYAGEIDSAVLMIHGDKAHSCYMSRDAFKLLRGDNKELLIIPGAVHTDLYDRKDIIPFDKIQRFFEENLK